jgi:protein-S-isoprenylcysteine O-methyltransferase Ste14
MFAIDLIVGISWICFWIYWISMSIGNKQNVQYPSFASFSMRILIISMTGLTLRFFLANHKLQSNNILYLHVIGLVLFFCGLAVAIWARVYLGKNWGMPMTQKLKPELVTSGPYRFIRHPIYSGILLAMFASALAVTPYWLIAGIVIGVYFTCCAFVEEKIMLKEFPQKYSEYKKHSRMLIPFVL